MYQKSFLAKVLGSNYKTLNGNDVIDYIDKALKTRGTELNPYQKEVLLGVWAGEYGRLPFEAFERKSQKENASFMWRLSAVPLGLWLTMLFIFIPVKWVITGKPYYSGGKISQFTASWIDKVRG